MKFINEINENIKINVIKEDKTGNKSYFIEGVFLQGNITNRNRRFYPVEILDREVKRYNEEYVKQNRACGELGHPENPSINLDRVSHLVKSLKKEGTNYVGKAKLLDTPFGKIAKNLVDEGVKFGVSSRGLGSLQEKDGVNYVADDFKLMVAADIVSDPSAPDAFVSGIMENVEWLFVPGKGWISQLIEDSRNRIKATPSRKLEEQKIKEFYGFLKNLSENL